MPDAVPRITVEGAPPAAKKWWASRTLWINAAVLGLAAAEAQLGVLQPLLPIKFYQLVAFGLPVLNAVLRFLTTQGVRL